MSAYDWEEGNPTMKFREMSSHTPFGINKGCINQYERCVGCLLCFFLTTKRFLREERKVQGVLNPHKRNLTKSRQNTNQRV